MSNTTNIRPRFSALALVATLTACSNDVVDLGGGTVTRDIAYGSRCAESPIVEGDVAATNQDELDALLGCEEIRGAFSVRIFEDTDLSPLADLRAVDGNFVLGEFTPFPNDLSEEAIQQYQLEYERLVAIAEAGWLESLAGVESLERVGGFILNRIGAPDLSEFESLRLVGGNVDSDLSAYVSISGAPNLVDLAGLENLRGFRAFNASDNPALESLDGLQMSTTLDDLTLQNNPLLSNIDALLPLTYVAFDVFFYGTGLTNLDGLANLDTAALGIALWNNPELTNADALDNLQSAQGVIFEDNPKLERLPEFINLSGIDYFKAMRNASLQSITLNFPNRYSINIIDGVDVPIAAGVIEIGDNDQLESLTFEAGFQSAQVVSIYRNPSLAQLDLGSLQRLDRLDILGNTALTDVALGELQTVDTLRVFNNTLLSTTELRDVRTFQSDFGFNADDPPPAP